VLAQQVATVLEHIERSAGGDVRNPVIPPMPRIIDRQLMLRRQNGMRAVEQARRACRFNVSPPPPATASLATPRKEAKGNRVGSAAMSAATSRATVTPRKKL
jgi:hypothetical protein